MQWEDAALTDKILHSVLVRSEEGGEGGDGVI